MSVILLSLEHYKVVFQKACIYQFHRTVDIDYCASLSCTESQLKTLIKDWYKMNYLSDCKRNNEPYDDEYLEWELQKIDKFKNEFPKCSTYQMLKALECINYQIEDIVDIPEVKETELSASYSMLIEAIDEIKDTIIGRQPEYKNAKWCIF